MRTFQFLTAAATAALLAGVSAASAEPVVKFDDVSQTTKNHANVTNNGDINHSFTSISGDGASLSISATGAVSSLSVSSIHGSEFDTIEVGTNGSSFPANLFQSTSNYGGVTNNHTGNWLIDIGLVDGDGASASVSATGGVSSISVSSINTPGTYWTNSDTSFGSIKQETWNAGTVSNNGGSIWAGEIKGIGASLSIGATGAVSSVSMSGIADSDTFDTIHAKSISQGTTNYYNASITNGGSITAGDISGVGASASVSASGAVSSVSVSNIGGASQFDHVHFQNNITQTTTNYAPVTNSGTVQVGALTGNGASASVSAVGAVSAVSYSSIK